MKRTHKLLIAGLGFLLISGCNGERDVFDPDNHDQVDPGLSLSRDDYRKLNDASHYRDPNNPAKQLNPAEPPIPELAEILAVPKPPKIAASKLVSVAVTDDVPLKDVLIELARLADVDIEIDAGITGGISFRAKDRPFNEVVERIADLAGLRYKMKNGVLRIERDTAYVNTYGIDFLNIDRDSSGSTSLTTNVLSSGGGEGGAAGLTTGSTTELTSQSKSDFWQQFEAGVEAIMAYIPPSRVSNISYAQQALGSPQEYDEDGFLIPVAAAAPVASAAPEENGAFYVVNRQAGTLTISGTQYQHRMIGDFLGEIRKNMSSQVLIEAKIVEITLNDKFQSGIDWSQLGGSKIGMPFKFGSVDDAANVATFGVGPINDIAGLGIDLQAAVELAKVFGTTRTLSSPRLHAMNNQQAVMTFAENTVYFTLEIDRETTVGTATPVTDINVTATLNTVPIGIILSLQPSISVDTNEVTLSVRPTLSRITGFVNDPSVAYLIATLPAGTPTAGLNSPIPIVEVRELDTILKLQSGQVMVIGGLMEEKSQNTDRGVPWVSEIPYLGNAFKGVDKNTDLTELVIFIRATIVGTHGNVHTMDKAIYEKFTRDPRPLKF